DARLAEAGPLDDVRHRSTSSPEILYFDHSIRQELRLPPKLHASVLGFCYAIHLTFATNVVLELGDQGKDAQDELASAGRGVDRGIIHDLEANALLSELGNDAIEI